MFRILLLLPAAWGVAALWFDGPAQRGFAIGLSVAFALASVVLLLRVRPFAAGLLVWTMLFAALIAWWLSIEPRSDRPWMADVAELPRAEIAGDRVTIRNVRNCNYRSEADYDARWETRRYNLADLRGLDLFLCYWGPREIAHTILSWEFTGGEHLAISIETRKELGEQYSAVRGFFRQYELYYVVADERDLVGLRTDHRGEQVYLYRLATPPERARELLLQYLQRINDLADHPAWYNAATQNCTTVIFDHVRPIVGSIPFDSRILRNGRLDEMLHERGILSTALPFEALRERSLVNAAARGAGADFSAAIRAGLPDRPPSP